MMKKTILKAALVLSSAFFCSAQGNAQVTSEMRDFYSNAVVTNDTIYFWVGVGQLHVWNFNQYNMSANSVTYKFYKNNVSLTSGSSTNFCVFHNNDQADPQSQCYIPTVMQSGNFVTDPGEFNTLVTDFTSGPNPGVSVVRYKVSDINNPSDSIDLTLIYNVTAVGIAEQGSTTVGEPYPNPSNGNVSVSFAFSNANSGTAVATDINGRVVYSEAINAPNGILNVETSGWANGVYVLTIADENGIATRRKIVVE